MAAEGTAYHVHICLYSHQEPPFKEVFAPSEALKQHSARVEKEKQATKPETRGDNSAPRTLYEIARKVDRPLDVRLSPLSLLWLDKFAKARICTPRKTKNNVNSRQHSMSPEVGRKPLCEHDNTSEASHGAHQSKAAYSSSTPIARFEKESSFRIDDESTSAQPGTAQSGASEIAFGIVHLFRDDAALNDRANAKTKTTLEDDTGSVLAVLGVPAHIGPADFLQLIEPAADAISQVRMIREEVTNRCMVLLKFRDPANAEEFHKMYADQPFDPIEMPNELCRVVYVTKVSVSTTSTLPYAYPLLANSDPWPVMRQDGDASAVSSVKIPALAELPTCPVCLERMDASVTGLMTVTCQHTFHCSCLSKWSDSRCPVCRYTQSRLTKKGQNVLPSFVPENGRCAVCGTGADLWVCLICATVGCGRYKAGHAHRHYHETGHLYSLELETQRVWDYAGDGYVHRLIQSKADFASIDDYGPTPKTALELSAPNAPTKKGQKGTEASSSSAGRVASHAELEEKMEALGLEYSNLLSTQLESQRAFYEDQVRAHQIKAEDVEASNRSLAASLAAAHRERDDLLARFEAVSSRSEHLHTNMDASLKRVKRLDEELRSERLMSKGLVGRIDKLTLEDKSRAEEVAALRNENAELKEQVRDLMFFLEARTKVENEGGEELRGGDVEVGKSKKQASVQEKSRSTEASSVAPSKAKSKKKRNKGKSHASAAAACIDESEDAAQALDAPDPFAALNSETEASQAETRE